MEANTFSSRSASNSPSVQDPSTASNGSPPPHTARRPAPSYGIEERGDEPEEDEDEEYDPRGAKPRKRQRVSTEGDEGGKGIKRVEEDTLLNSLAESGGSIEEIAQRLGRSAGAVKRRLQPARTDTAGLATRGDRWTADDDEVVTRLSTEGASAADIAAEVNRSEEAVKNRLRNPPGGVKPAPSPLAARPTGSSRARNPSEAALAAQAVDSFFDTAEPERHGERTRTHWTEEDDANILKWREESIAWTEIASRLNCTMSAVTGHWTKMKRKMGIEPRRSGASQPWTKEHDKLLREGRVAGNSYASIAEQLGRTTSSVGNRWVKKSEDWTRKGLLPKPQVLRLRSPSPSPPLSPPPRLKNLPPGSFTQLPRPPHLPSHPPSAFTSTQLSPYYVPDRVAAHFPLSQPYSHQPAPFAPLPSASRPSWSTPASTFPSEKAYAAPGWSTSSSSDASTSSSTSAHPSLVSAIPSKPYRPRRRSYPPDSSFAPPATKPVFRNAKMGLGPPARGVGALSASQEFVRTTREGVRMGRAGRVWVLEEEVGEGEDELRSSDG
ncbi:hypothetical protein JCM11251_007965 [Rhodosporidiobolus azoricus]